MQRAVAFIPLRGMITPKPSSMPPDVQALSPYAYENAFSLPLAMIVLGVDQESHAAHFLRDRHATLSGAPQRPSAEPASLHAAIDGEAAETVDGNFIAAETVRHGGGRAAEKPRMRAGAARGVATKHFAPPLPWFWRA